MKNKKIIDNKYIKVKTLGSGGEGVVYLVLDKDTNTELVCKIIEPKIRNNELEKIEDKKILEEKINIFNKICSIKSPYIIHCFKDGNGFIKKNDEILKSGRHYFIFEYAPEGDLWKIIRIAKGFKEKYSKLIFKKILLGVQALHKAGIYHLDLKVDNIVIDNEYNPKICDFGFATDKQGKLKDTRGTRNLKPPQKSQGQEYSGEKADIFSLGCILFTIVVGGDCFKKPLFYERIKGEYVKQLDKDKYFNTLSSEFNVINTLSKEFKDLHFRMIAYEEEDRPNNIEEILEDNWFDEIRDLSDEKQKELEDEVKAKFIEKINIINNALEKNPHLLDKDGYGTSSKNKGISKGEIIQYFKSNFSLIKKDIKLNGEYYIKLLGDFKYYVFMNYFVNEIQKYYKNENCFITNVKENYKCNIVFQKDEEEDNEDNEKDLIIRLNLYRARDKELILRFLRKSGDKHEYNEKVLDIISLINEISKVNA